MEDRHSVSDPLPVDDDGRDFPSWEVDILRDGVIVDTFILNKEVLPPRTNKKGKVVWKLPDSGEKMVSDAVKMTTRRANSSRTTKTLLGHLQS